MCDGDGLREQPRHEASDGLEHKVSSVRKSVRKAGGVQLGNGVVGGARVGQASVM